LLIALGRGSEVAVFAQTATAASQQHTGSLEPGLAFIYSNSKNVTGLDTPRPPWRVLETVSKISTSRHPGDSSPSCQHRYSCPRCIFDHLSGTILRIRGEPAVMSGWRRLRPSLLPTVRARSFTCGSFGTILVHPDSSVLTQVERNQTP